MGRGSRSRFLKNVLLSTENFKDLQKALFGCSPQKQRRARGNMPQIGSFERVSLLVKK